MLSSVAAACSSKLNLRQKRLPPPKPHAPFILDPHDAAVDTADAIALIAELEDVAGQALDGEILVHGADEIVLRLQQHLIVRIIGNGAAGGERGEPRAAAAAQEAVDGVMVDE